MKNENLRGLMETFNSNANNLKESMPLYPRQNDRDHSKIDIYELSN